jgi:hypothetical protein
VKPTLFNLLFLMTLSCTPVKNNETVADSTQNIVKDSTASQIEETSTSSSIDESIQSSSIDETSEPFSGITNNFPEFSMAVLTNDSLEVEINNRMGQLLQVYDTMQYATVMSSYSWERPHYVPAQDGEGSMDTEREGEKKTWFFDRFNRLKGYSMSLANDFTRKSVVYLFSNDSLIAVSEQQEYLDEGNVIEHLTILASQCPNCGLATTNNGGGQVNYLNEKDLAFTQNEFNDSMTELINILKAGRKKAMEDGDDFVFSVNRTKEGDEDESQRQLPIQ